MTRWTLVILAGATGCAGQIGSDEAALPEAALEQMDPEALAALAEPEPLDEGSLQGDVVESAQGATRHHVKTKSQLFGALKKAKKGDVVYVDDHASMDLSHDPALVVPGGVTLESGHTFWGGGALLYSTNYSKKHLVSVGGDNVRIKNIRLRGPQQHIGAVGSRYIPVSGIRSSNKNGLIVSGSELYGWPEAAINISGGKWHRVHHNFIHHNRRYNLGYGVVLNGKNTTTNVLIDYNIFNANRHAVAASGYTGQEYEARFNVVLGEANGHVFDMHGEYEHGLWSYTAGSYVNVHHNTILTTNAPVRSGDPTSGMPIRGVVVRGVPKYRALVENNCFTRSDSSTFAHQEHGRTPIRPMKNMYVRNNRGGKSLNSCGAMGDGPRWCVSRAGKNRWATVSPGAYPLAETVWGDFDGDGKADALRARGDGWLLSSGGNGRWQPAMGSKTRAYDLKVGDFNGDGKDDVFTVWGGAFRVSYGAKTGWKRLASTGHSVHSLQLADFNGDGKADVFLATGKDWYVSYAGTGSWKHLSTSKSKTVRLGDIDGDGRTDVVTSFGGAWHVRYGGRGSWKKLRNSSLSITAVALADLNGDGKDDAWTTSNGRWLVAWGAKGSLQHLNTSSIPLLLLRSADVDGDGKADIVGEGC
ncbi:MAG: VCBS repeat-containing protein [Myxococcales bacterium]|nr:VCBS repeat-containing protein [Myxococcales bacterium]